MVTNNVFPLEVRECDYKGEHYSAREDGMVLRHARPGMRIRKRDNEWTYGNLNAANGYLYIGSARVHIIVATAFHGARDSKVYVVDHIDTNRQNNRPDNLRWVTRLENILNNEITRKKVELICGSVEAFLENPRLLFGHEKDDKNFTWMRNVTKEEAQNCLANWSHWAKTAKPDPNYKKSEHHMGGWIFDKPSENSNSKTTFFKSDNRKDDFVNPFMNMVPDKSGGYTKFNESASVLEESINTIVKEQDGTTESLTPSARQRNWLTPTEFPFCPEIVKEDGLQVYLDNLKVGEIFSKNEKYDPSYVADKGMSKNKDALIVLTTNPKSKDFWAIAVITIENNKYVHQNDCARAGKELSTKMFKYYTGQGELTDDDYYWYDAIR
jgi:hypothetical protein